MVKKKKKENQIKAIITLTFDFQGFRSIYFSCVLQHVYTLIYVYTSNILKRWLLPTTGAVSVVILLSLRPRGVLLLASNSRAIRSITLKIFLFPFYFEFLFPSKITHALSFSFLNKRELTLCLCQYTTVSTCIPTLCFFSDVVSNTTAHFSITN